MILSRNYLIGLAAIAMGSTWFAGTVSTQSGPADIGAMTYNIDFNGARNAPDPRGPGPTYVGQGAAGGGNTWNGVLVDSILPDGNNDDNLTVGYTNMVNSLGDTTGVSFTISPVAGDGPNAGTDPNATAALFGDYMAVGAAGQTTGIADFTFSGLGDVPFVDVYFYWAYNANFNMPGATLVPFVANGAFTPANTVHYAKLPVVNGIATGTVGTGPATIVLYGMTIQAPLPAPIINSVSPSGNEVKTNAPIIIELQDYVTQVVPSSVQLLVNGQVVAATVSKPAGSAITTVTYNPVPAWVPGSTNTFSLIFGDTSTPSVMRTNNYSFAALDEALAAVTYNLDFNGTRNSPGQLGPATTYVGQGPAGGASVWNGVNAESQQPDGSNDDNLTVSTNNVLNSLGEDSTVSFSVGPVACSGFSAGVDPTASSALLSDYLVVGIGNGGQITGIADFTISGLGDTPFVDLYFIYGASGEFFITNNSPAMFVGGGIYTPANVRYFAKVPVANGTITGVMGTGTPTTLLYGLTIQKPLPRPYVKSYAPIIGNILGNAPVIVELEDYVTQVVPTSVQLLVNGQVVAATVSKPTGSTTTTITYDPSPTWVPGSTNIVKVVYGDDSATPVVQTKTFSFVAVDEALAKLTYNLDFNGTRNSPGQLGPAVTFSGPSAVGGGTIWNGVKAESQQPDGSNDDNMTVSTNDVLNSLGEPSSVSFSIGPVACSGTSAGSSPTDGRALFGDYVLVGIGNGGQITGIADFSISGLGDVPFVDLYFYSGGSSEFFIPGASRTPFTASGIYATTTTYHPAGSGVTAFAKVAVTNGTITGVMGTGNPLTILYGLTIQKPLPRPFIKSASPTGAGVLDNSPISVELQDYITQVVPSSVQLLVNGQAVTATVTKPSGSAITAVTYTPPGNWKQGSTNTIGIIFSDSATPPVVQTNYFTFAVLNEALAAVTVNLDFNGARNNPVPRGPGPTFSGQGAAGGGSVWNGVLANSQLPDGTDNDNITVTTNNLLNSIGGATTIGFTIGPVAGDDLNAGSDPTATAALFGDYILVGSGAQITGQADFTISGLNDMSVVDLYFYYGSTAAFTIPGATAKPFAASQTFTSANTMYFPSVAVANGSVTGTMGNGGLTILYGMTIQKPLVQPGPLSIALQGNAIVLSWPGTATLQAADDLAGQWTDVASTSPQTITPTAGHKFYRLRQ
ncbi:MAG: hypothetical protein M1608_12875 [Candidatus Omnitrophica bacterium]|nr:hypothetical protein [Candidatus Omnitrophota bacterium]